MRKANIPSFIPSVQFSPVAKVCVVIGSVGGVVMCNFSSQLWGLSMEAFLF